MGCAELNHQASLIRTVVRTVTFGCSVPCTMPSLPTESIGVSLL
jgi:hypothetical protein